MSQASSTFQEKLAKLADYLEAASRLARELSQNKTKIPKDQAWFFSKKWQDMEKEADEDIKTGRVKSFKSALEVVTFLDSLT